MSLAHVLLRRAGFGSRDGMATLLCYRYTHPALHKDARQDRQLFNVLFYPYCSVCGLISDLLHSIKSLIQRWKE